MTASIADAFISFKDIVLRMDARQTSQPRGPYKNAL